MSPLHFFQSSHGLILSVSRLFFLYIYCGSLNSISFLNHVEFLFSYYFSSLWTAIAKLSSHNKVFPIAPILLHSLSHSSFQKIFVVVPCSFSIESFTYSTFTLNFVPFPSSPSCPYISGSPNGYPSSTAFLLFYSPKSWGSTLLHFLARFVIYGILNLKLKFSYLSHFQTT